MGLIGADASAQEAVIRPGTPRAGRTPGTQEWLAVLRGRTFSLPARFAAIRAEPDRTRRRALIDAIAADSRREQQDFATHIQQIGGRVLRYQWIFHACTIEVPIARFADATRHASVGVMWPNEERAPACVPPFVATGTTLPIGDSRTPDNHNIDQAHISLPHLGAGANVAIFDTGVDLDHTGETGGGGGPPDPDHHRAFLTGTTSRIIWSQKIGTIDCNDAAIDPWCPIGGPVSARHGTGVAAVAVGQEDPIPTNPNPPPTYKRFAAGHAPGAQLLSFSISDPGTPVWPTSLDNVLAAVQALMDWSLQGFGAVHVLNISYDLWPDPQHPTQLALDLLEREFDVLVVSSASNEGDASSQSSGYVNGLAVANVHKWSFSGSVLTTRYPHRGSARGPLFADHDRYFPDVCATGASIGTSLGGRQVAMPLVDDQYLPVPSASNPCRGLPLGPGTEWYDAAGTSMASPQVAGAAALYRAERPSASALETKAAVLLTTVDPFQYSNTNFAFDRKTYADRNATGVGYLRDDLLARYALRTTADKTIGTQVVLSGSTPSATVTYPNLSSGEHYAVAIAWPRQFPDGFDPSSGTKIEWPNIDLEVLTTGDVPQITARSDSLRNTYEHLVFVAVSSTATIRVTAANPPTEATPVYVAARKVTTISVNVQGTPVALTSRRSIPGFVAELTQLGACSQSVPDQRVALTLPAAYAEAYGSLAFGLAPLFSSDPFPGMPIGKLGAQADILENIFAAAEIGATTSFTVRGLALRTWAPFQGCSGNLGITEIWMYSRVLGTGQLLQSLLYQTTPPTAPNATLVASNLSIPVHPPSWSARGYRTWPIIIPFSSPFTVDPTKALGIWIRFSNNVCGSLDYQVDAINDDVGYGERYVLFRGPLSGPPLPGRALIFGLLEGSTGTRPPRLDVYGFPREGETVLFHVRQAAPNSVVVIQLGYTNPNTVIGSCLQLASSDLVSSLPVTTSSMGDGSVSYAIPSGLLHRHVFAQASTTFGTTTLRSNGLRLTIGGVVP